ncbi:hypothetical protein V6Z11_D08G102200 [Gossypium hirsutum]
MLFVWGLIWAYRKQSLKVIPLLSFERLAIHDASVIGPYIRDIKALVRCFYYCRFMHVTVEEIPWPTCWLLRASRGGGRSFERSGVPDFALQVVERDRHDAFARESGSFVGPFAA